MAEWVRFRQAEGSRTASLSRSRRSIRQTCPGGLPIIGGYVLIEADKVEGFQSPGTKASLQVTRDSGSYDFS